MWGSSRNGLVARVNSSDAKDTASAGYVFDSRPSRHKNSGTHTKVLAEFPRQSRTDFPLADAWNSTIAALDARFEQGTARDEPLSGQRNCRQPPRLTHWFFFGLGAPKEQNTCTPGYLVARWWFLCTLKQKARYVLNSGLSLTVLGWLMGLEPTTTGITILDSTN